MPKEFFEFSTNTRNRENMKLFTDIWNQGIDSHLEAFTRSNVSDEKGYSKGSLYRVFKIHSDEVRILLRRLSEIDTDQARNWHSQLELHARDEGFDTKYPVIPNAALIKTANSWYEGGSPLHVFACNNGKVLSEEHRSGLLKEIGIAIGHSLTQKNWKDLGELRKLHNYVRVFMIPKEELVEV